ncbi:hypothetical protein Sango_2431600 [Sesamum angolense]|uniref:Uncharacterized protein n=1 Tax=Sesamum angolense TaxID=2727404 RepID=A0AAE2BK17_9LAMI|nr:hypothetical protein Sango_2431600 [Sesamum angolense]
MPCFSVIGVLLIGVLPIFDFSEFEYFECDSTAALKAPPPRVIVNLQVSIPCLKTATKAELNYEAKCNPSGLLFLDVRGCVDVSNSAIRVDPNFVSTRIQKSIKQMDDLLQKYPMSELENESVSDIMD